MAEIHESLSEFAPLAEQALRANGTMRVKVIAPGWGASGFYSREVLERDIPRAYPPGTHMYWNHPTMSESMDRPERDLSHLAAVTVSAPVWEETGPKGPGMYADVKPFSPYSTTINEIADHIGVSILGDGRVSQGEAEGKQGRIVEEITRGKSVDFVTRPGAGGAIVSLFEAAGREPEEIPGDGAGSGLQEAANIGEWLESRLHLRLTQIADDMFGDGHITREERIALSSAIGDALGVYHQSISDNAPQLYQRRPFSELPAETAQAPVSESEQENNSMSEEQLQEAQGRITQLEEQLRQSNAAVARLNESLILRDARDLVDARLSETELPELTRRRLRTSLVGNPPVTEAGALDEARLGEAVTATIDEAKAELAAILEANTGRITGMGESNPQSTPNGQALKESQSRIDAAMATLGYGQRQEA